MSATLPRLSSAPARPHAPIHITFNPDYPQHAGFSRRSASAWACPCGCGWAPSSGRTRTPWMATPSAGRTGALQAPRLGHNCAGRARSSVGSAAPRPRPRPALRPAAVPSAARAGSGSPAPTAACPSRWTSPPRTGARRARPALRAAPVLPCLLLRRPEPQPAASCRLMSCDCPVEEVKLHAGSPSMCVSSANLTPAQPSASWPRA